MQRLGTADYRPLRPPLSARWTEWSALLRPLPRRLEQAQLAAAQASAAAAGPVLVLPGLARGDGQTVRLRQHLAGLGFSTGGGWGSGINAGPTRRVLDRLSERLLATAGAGRPVNIVGFSMGGLFARWLARRHPAWVRQVVTVTAPFRSPLDSFFLPLRQVAPLWPCDVAEFVASVEARPSVPFTCLYTVTDGTVAWQSCVDPGSPEDCFAFDGPHVTMTSNPAVWSVLVERLVRPLPPNAAIESFRRH